MISSKSLRRSLIAPLSYSMVVNALVDDGQKMVTVPAANPLFKRAFVIRSVISWMSALPFVLTDIDFDMTAIFISPLQAGVAKRSLVWMDQLCADRQDRFHGVCR